MGPSGPVTGLFYLFALRLADTMCQDSYRISDEISMVKSEVNSELGPARWPKP